MINETGVAIVFPHPDDEAFGTVGCITRFREADIPVTYLCGTLGEMGRNLGTTPFANRETIREIRKKELTDVCEFLDIDLRLLGYRDKTIEFENREKLIEHIKAELTDLDPSLVITFYPDHGVHPDHNAIGEATIEAVRRINPEQRPTVWAVAMTHNYEEILGQPDIEVPVDDFQIKLEAILKHKSQTGSILEKLEESVEAREAFIEELKGMFGRERFFTWDFDKQ